MKTKIHFHLFQFISSLVFLHIHRRETGRDPSSASLSSLSDYVCTIALKDYSEEELTVRLRGMVPEPGEMARWLRSPHDADKTHPFEHPQRTQMHQQNQQMQRQQHMHAHHQQHHQQHQHQHPHQNQHQHQHQNQHQNQRGNFHPPSSQQFLNQGANRHLQGQQMQRLTHLVASGRLQPQVEEETSESGFYDEESTYQEDASSYQDEETSEPSEMHGQYGLAGRRRDHSSGGRRAAPYVARRGGGSTGRGGGPRDRPLPQYIATQILAQALAQAGITGMDRAALKHLAAGGGKKEGAASVAPGAVRCINWPSCEFGNRCRYHHPSEICKFFPHCRETGATCMYIHPSVPCPQGKACEEGARCNYSHPPAAASDVELAASTPRINRDCKFGPNCLLPGTCPYRHPDKELEAYFQNQAKSQVMSD
jgi:hypothetical protein